MDEQLSDILATCLRRIEAGGTLDECLAAYPAERAELEPLLRVAARLQALPRSTPLPAAAQAAITGRVLGHLQAQPAAATGALPAPPPAAGRQPLDPSAWLAGVLRALGYRGPLAQPWLRLGALALALILALALAATSYAAARALFPPAAAPAALAPATRFELAGPIEATSEAAITIAGVTLDLGPQTVITGTPAAGAAARATGQIRDDGTLLAETIAVEPAATGPTALPSPGPTLAPTEAPVAVATAAAPTAAPAPPTAEPTGAPVVEPPPPTAAPAAPAPAGEPFARLRQLLEAGAADGRAGGDAGEFLKKLAEAEQAFARGDAKKTGDQLRDLYQKLREKAREGKTDPAFAQEAQGIIGEIAAAYGIRGVPDKERGGGGDDD
jgi:hypothetical protein